MSKSTYWTGGGIDLEELWAQFDDGRAYETKVAQRPLHLLRIHFGGHSKHLPLFDNEAICQTVRGTFYDVKMDCFPPESSSQFVPLFLHRIERGSAIFDF